MRTRQIPTMRELMDDPVYRAYMKRVPRLPMNLRTGYPWQLWMRTDEGKWLTRSFESYRDVWPVFVKYFQMPDRDVTITSRRVFYAPPGEWYRVKVKRPRRPTPDDKSTTKIVIEDRWRQAFFWDDIRLRWCGRCRRPVYWQPLHDGHHAMKRLPAISTEGNQDRCMICGIRDEATPDIMQMTRMEAKPEVKRR